MQECLQATLAQGKISEELIPARLVVAVKSLLSAALAAEATPTATEDPSASIAAYRLAADALRTVKPEFENQSAKLVTALKSYSSFLDTLKQPRDLTPHDRQNIEVLSEFFSTIFRSADNETTESTIALESIELP
jgi:hypothetical protein